MPPVIVTGPGEVEKLALRQPRQATAGAILGRGIDQLTSGEARHPEPASSGLSVVGRGGDAGPTG